MSLMETPMLRHCRHTFARRGDLVVALLIGAALACVLGIVGLYQIAGIDLEDYSVHGDQSQDYLHIIMSAREAPLASVAFSHVAAPFANYGGEVVELDELPGAWQRLCKAESRFEQPEAYDEQTSGASLRTGWPLRVELLGGRTKEWPWELQLSWLGVTLIREGQSVGSLPYRPAILPLLANIVILAMPIMILLGLIRTQIALVRDARSNCTACGYPRPKTICPECGWEH